MRDPARTGRPQTKIVLDKCMKEVYNKGVERMVLKMTLKSYRVEMTNIKTGKKEIRHTVAESKKLAKCLIWVREDIISHWKINKIEEE